MEVTVSIARTPFAADDPMKAYVWLTWSRIAEALKEDFAPCLPVVLESLMAGVAGVEVLGTVGPASNPVVSHDSLVLSLTAVGLSIHCCCYM